MSNKNDKGAVKLRKKELPSGNISLYLDVFHNGKRSYEFLKLYLVPTSTKQAKELNKETLLTAQAVRAKRQIEIQNNEYGFASSFKLDTLFLDYFAAMTDKRRASSGNYGNWDSALKHLQKYCKADTTFNDVDIKFVEGFKKYLATKAKTKSDKPLSANTQQSYFVKLRACLNQAFNDRVIHINPTQGVESPKNAETERNYLTLDEVRALAQTECRYPVMKRAFLFSCLSGLRWSDINKMMWAEVQSYNGGTRVVFKQQKTGGQEYLDLNPQALELMGARGKDTDRVFAGLKYSAYHNVELTKWCLKAGITKDITFHCGRHTFAVMMLDLGAEIYTVSKLLGHRELKTTQVYAKILDKKKQEAVNLIPNINLSK